MLSEHDVRSVALIIGGHGDWFSAQLLRLIHKAHGEPRELLRQAFPYSVGLVEHWETAPNGWFPDHEALTYYAGKW